jgi:hypothetical protein
MDIVQRKTFSSAADALVASRVEHFIKSLRNGAGSWADRTEVPISDVAPRCTLLVVDKVGTDRGPLRYIELLRDDRVIVTFVYEHFTRKLVRTF